jgi:hypothetical protein
VHTGLAVITGIEDRQHSYVALTRGTMSLVREARVTRVLDSVHALPGEQSERLRPGRCEVGSESSWLLVFSAIPAPGAPSESAVRVR